MLVLSVVGGIIVKGALCLLSKILSVLAVKLTQTKTMNLYSYMCEYACVWVFELVG